MKIFFMKMNEKHYWEGNRFGDEGVKTMSELLKMNTDLNNLNFGSEE